MPSVLLGARPKPPDFLRLRLGKSFSLYLRYAHLSTRTVKQNKALWGHNLARDSRADGEFIESVLSTTQNAHFVIHSWAVLISRFRIVINFRIQVNLRRANLRRATHVICYQL